MGLNFGKVNDIDNSADCGKSFLCHPSGIIISKTLFSCSFCKFITDSAILSQQHYETTHINYLNLKASKTCKNETSFGPLVLIHEENDQLQCTSIKSKDNLCYSCSLNQTCYSQTNEEDFLDSYKNKRFSSIVCEACKKERFFSCVQSYNDRKICIFCYRFFEKFLTRPRVYSCPSLGFCSNKIKCKACFLNNIFKVSKNGQLQSSIGKILNEYEPIFGYYYITTSLCL